MLITEKLYSFLMHYTLKNAGSGLPVYALSLLQKIIFPVFILLSGFQYLYSQDTAQQVVSGRKNAESQYSKAYVILISADGFRYDYADKYKAKNLLRLARSGAKAKSMIPSFPSVTFPNHYTIATGLYPSHHGLVYNQFYDRNKKEGLQHA